MGKQQRVILYGQSVILATMGASLAHYPDLQVFELSLPLPGADALAALAPNVILFDVDAGHPEAVFDFLKQSPHLLLIGVNPEDEQLQLWSSGRSSVASTGGIVQVITQFRE